ncbi:CopD family protein [Aliamphritea spongicola]|uniref:CopD family protein n=1 Tax=Aliamphritea spongicola TaxID=707589 RepID=UPI00196A842D|nr:CopD family protein [Aliamphritea spongicola]MBN3562976.1 CopD family protein [Aliamphritea spongicola]
MYEIFLLLHVLAATVWTGGHLVLAVGVLPRVLKHSDVAYIKAFESGFEKIGIPALIIQVLTGLHLAYRLLPDFGLWFNFSDPISRVISFKLILLLCTFLLAIDARLRVIPKLSADNLVSLAWHIIPVTVISVLFVVVGVSFKTGWFF